MSWDRVATLDIPKNILGENRLSQIHSVGGEGDMESVMFIDY